MFEGERLIARGCAASDRLAGGNTGPPASSCVTDSGHVTRGAMPGKPVERLGLEVAAAGRRLTAPPRASEASVREDIRAVSWKEREFRAVNESTTYLSQSASVSQSASLSLSASLNQLRLNIGARARRRSEWPHDVPRGTN